MMDRRDYLTKRKTRQTPRHRFIGWRDVQHFVDRASWEDLKYMRQMIQSKENSLRQTELDLDI